MQQNDSVGFTPRPGRQASHSPDTALLGQPAAATAVPSAALVARLAPVVRARVVRRLGRGARSADVDDVVQDLWVRLLEPGSPLARWNPGGMSLENYIGRAAGWQAGRCRRRGVARGELALEEASEPTSCEDPERALCLRRRVERFREYLATMPERGRKIFDALYVDGMTPGEVAESCGVAPQVVYNWQHRIRTLCRAALGGG